MATATRPAFGPSMPFVLAADHALALDDPRRTTFVLRLLGGDAWRLSRMLEDAHARGRLQPRDFVRLVLRAGLVAWIDLRDDRGIEVPFRPDAVTERVSVHGSMTNLVVDGPPSCATLDFLRDGDATELARAILEANGIEPGAFLPPLT